MDIDILMAPAEKRLDISTVTGVEGDFVTLQLWPMEEKTKINLARANGMKVDGLTEIVAENPEIDYTDAAQIGELLKKKPELLSKFTANPDFDGGLKYMTLALEFGVDPVKHSMQQKGKSVQLTRKVWDRLIHGAEGGRLARFIVANVEALQTEYSLKN